MTNEELKAAMIRRKPVIYRSKRYGESRYKRIYAIRYALNESDKLIIQVELLDYNNNSINTVNGSEVFLDND